ncbi:hypothetical protein BGZ97_005831 [Linnemannia gamsii]|jgi:hypothetical protein|uniref:Uncharacterized protein n=1 Tax=Linnemannia gamsii TaxID=64522 RepID=A0A9P6QRZ9_9FUNG|nr:hypothetical protein BGZ97_005831 [Linnemannia gamsii]
MADKSGFETSAGAPACKLYKKPNLKEGAGNINEIQNGKVQNIPGGVEVMSVDVTQGYEAILHYNGKSYTYGPGAHNVIHAPHHKVKVDSVQIVESADYLPADDAPARR